MEAVKTLGVLHGVWPETAASTILRPPSASTSCAGRDQENLEVTETCFEFLHSCAQLKPYSC
jgi:hypothetical protein